MAYTVIKITDPKRSISNYTDEVRRYGIKIDEIKHCQLWGHNGKTYLIETNRPREISKISVDSWKCLKSNLQGDE